MAKLSKSDIDALRPNPDKDLFLWDSTLPGFGFKMTPAGHRSFVLQYRFDGKSRRYTIGAMSGALTLEQARDKARDLVAAIRNGSDPMAEKIARRNATTVNELLDAYIASPTFKDKAESTQATDIGRISAHIRPTVGRLIADRVTHDDVLTMRSAIAAGKTARVEKADRPRGRRIIRGGEGAAGQSVTLLSACYGWAIGARFGGLDHNPCEHVPGYVSRARDIAPAPGDYERIFAALDKLEAEKRIPSATADAIRLIAMLGLRRSEASGLRWRHVDLEGGRIVFDAREHKGGKKSRQPKTIFFAANAAAVLERQPRGEPDDFVFPPASGDTGKRLNKPWNLVRDEAKLPANFVLHGLRHAFGATLAANGKSALEIAAMLGHRQSSTAERYVAWADDPRRRIAEEAAAAIGAKGQ